MKRFTLQLCALSALCLILTSAPALAGKKPKEPQHLPTVISSVSADSITIREDKVMKTFAITQFTEITVKGQRAKLADLQPGMSVSITLGTDPTKASRISAGDPPPLRPKSRIAISSGAVAPSGCGVLFSQSGGISRYCGINPRLISGKPPACVQ